MTESQIEARAERMMDSLDRRLMAGRISDSDYQKQVKEIDAWVKDEMRFAVKGE